MCGFVGFAGPYGGSVAELRLPQATIAHRGPDASGEWQSASGRCAIAHNRLSILDLSDAGRQPMLSTNGRFTIAFNGEIYNYIELRNELGGREKFKTDTDTEVLLAAYEHWGPRCLDRLIGMFAIAIWDEVEQRLFLARDRFGVKPLFVHEAANGAVWFASEIKALHAAGVPREPDPVTWATYLTRGMYDHCERTFWKDIKRVGPGEYLLWSPAAGLTSHRWYDLGAIVQNAGPDERSDYEVGEELLWLLQHSVKLRLRSDVPVGVSLSGGLDSSLLLALIARNDAVPADITTFTFYCDDPSYDEIPWVEQVLAQTGHPARFCRLTPGDVIELAPAVQLSQDEPFGGLPILGLAKVHECAKAEGVKVILDGNGIDEGWAGYDYYARAEQVDPAQGPLQGSRSVPSLPECITPEFAGYAEQSYEILPFDDALRNLQYRDLMMAKIPRCMRFADRVSMMFSRELREPFLDQRIIELGLRQPAHRKIRDGLHKFLPRAVANALLPKGVSQAPKRALQTPQREWLRGPLAEWAEDRIESALDDKGGEWLDSSRVRLAWEHYKREGADNSFPIWQWITLGMMAEAQSNNSKGEAECRFQGSL